MLDKEEEERRLREEQKEKEIALLQVSAGQAEPALWVPLSMLSVHSKSRASSPLMIPRPTPVHASHCLWIV